VAWQDKRNGTDYNVYAQRINAAGQVQWTANGVAVCTASGSQSAVDMTSDGISGAIIAWKDLRSTSYDVYAQKINLAGIIQWAANGIGIVTSSGVQLNPNAVGDGSGGAIITWEDSSLGTSDIKTQRVDGAGILQWISGGIIIGSAPNDQTSPKNISDGAGGCIYAWQDKRNTGDLDIYAHRLYGNGTAAGIGQYAYAESKCFPNPFSSEAIIEIMHPAVAESKGEMMLLLSDVLGKKVEMPFSVSEKGICIKRGNGEAGIYLYEIVVKGTSISQGKLILTN